MVCGNLCANFCNKQTTFDKVLKKNTKNTDGPKFADPRVAAVSLEADRNSATASVTAPKLPLK